MIVDQLKKHGRGEQVEPDLTGPLDTEVLTGVREFAALEEEWGELWAASPAATPFQSWAWLFSWWENYGGGRLSLRLVAAREGRGGALVGLAPLMVERGFGPLPGRLLFLGSGEANYLDVIARAGFEEQVAGVMAEELRSMLGHGGIIDFGDLRSSATTWKLYRDWRGPKSSVPQAGCPVIDLGDGGWDGILSSLSKNRRSTVRRALRQAKADGVRGELADAGEAEAAARRLVALHRESWQGRDIAAEHLSERWASLMVTAGKRMTERGLGAVSELWRGDELLASHLLVFGHDFVGFLTIGASKEAMNDYQFSSLLIWDGVCRALDRGIPCFDMMQGEEAYKIHWCTSVAPKHRVIMARSVASWRPYAGYYVLGSRIVRYAKRRVKSEETPRWIEAAAKSVVRGYRILRRTTRRT